MAATFWQRYGMMVKYHREDKGWTQQQLAGFLGLASKASVSQIESGEVIPSGDKLVDLARLFGVTVSSMLGEGAGIRTHDADAELVQHLCAVFMMVPQPGPRRRILSYLLDAISQALKGEEPSPPPEPLLPCAGTEEG